MKSARSDAVIYTRVSSKGQADNYSLDNQERICRDYCQRQQLTVQRVFIESGESAKTAERVELQGMLRFVAANSRTMNAVVVYKVDRLARNSTDYGNLRLQLGRCGIRLLSATENLNDTPAGRFAETALAGIAQMDNEVRAERTREGMMAAVRAGKLVWRAPVGYVNGPRGGPSLIPDSPHVVPMVQKAWQLAASGMAPGEVGARLVKEGFRLRSGRVPSVRSFRAMLKSETYTGYISAFGMHVRGDFEPLIDRDLYVRVQQGFAKSSHAVARPYRKVNPDFPLRGTILCPRCGQPLTASWSRGHGGMYAYYRCGHCTGIDFRKHILERSFVDRLNGLSLKPPLLDRLGMEIEAGLREDTASARRALHEVEVRLTEQRKRRDQIIEKTLSGVLPDDDARRLLAKADRTIQEIEAERRRHAQEQVVDLDMVKTGLALLTEMGSLWERSDILVKTQLQRFVFPAGTSYDGQRFGTSALPACLQVRAEAIGSRGRMAPRVGLEPTTPGLTVQCYHH